MRDGTLGSPLAAVSLSLAEFRHLTPSLAVERMGGMVEMRRAWHHVPGIPEGAQDISSSNLGGGREGEQRQRDTTQTQFLNWHVSKHTRRRRSYFASTLSRDCTSGPILVLEQRFNQNAWLTCGPLSGVERRCNPRRWVARPSSGCRQMCLEAKSRGLPKSYCTVGCGTVPGCVAHCWVMKCTPGGFCRVCVLIWGRTEINGQPSMQKTKEITFVSG